MATPEQEAATKEVIGAMIDAAAEKMETLHPDHPVLARFDDLSDQQQNMLCAGLYPLLSSIATLLEVVGRS